MTYIAVPGTPDAMMTVVMRDRTLVKRVQLVVVDEVQFRAWRSIAVFLEFHHCAARCPRVAR